MNLFKRIKKRNVPNPIEYMPNINVRHWVSGNTRTISATDELVDTYIQHVLTAVSALIRIRFDHYPTMLEFTKDFAQSEFIERNEELARYLVTEIFTLIVVLASSNIPDDEDFNTMIKNEITAVEGIENISRYTVELLLRGSVKQVSDYVAVNFIEARGTAPFATIEPEIIH